ncbi:MAG: DUF302 domain-containing protein [Pyrinomonadaceae bacterium]
MSTATETTRSGYGYGRRFSGEFAETVARAKKALQDEGFGVLSEIDMKAKFDEKLGVQFHEYLILGACNPGLALQAISEEPELGLLLPCNVIVYRDGDENVVSAINASAMLGVTENPNLDATAAEVNQKLQRAIDSI